MPKRGLRSIGRGYLSLTPLGNTSSATMLAKQLLRALPRRGMRSLSVAVDAADEEHGGLSFALTDDQKVINTVSKAALCCVDARRARGVESGRGATARPQKEAQK